MRRGESNVRGLGFGSRIRNRTGGDPGGGDRGGDGVELLRFTSEKGLIRTVPQRFAPFVRR